jgi:Uma2 family endonuclease
MATVTETSSMVGVPPVLVPASTKSGFSLDSLPLRRFSVDEYYRMTRAGIIHEDEHVELICGVIVNMAARGGPHVTSCTNTRDTLVDKLGRTVVVRQESPIDLSITEPEPDVVVARGNSRDYVEHHPRPADILLLIEIAESSRAYDINVKVPLYAAAGIIEYWIIDLEHDRLEVFRDVVPADESHPAAYRTHLTFFAADSVTPVNFPNVQIKVADLLP